MVFLQHAHYVFFKEGHVFSSHERGMAPFDHLEVHYTVSDLILCPDGVLHCGQGVLVAGKNGCGNWDFWERYIVGDGVNSLL